MMRHRPGEKFREAARALLMLILAFALIAGLPAISPECLSSYAAVSSTASSGASAPQAFSDPSSEEDAVRAEADRLLASMTLSEKIAQMMIVSMPADNAAKIQSKYQFGGYILFARDFSGISRSRFKKTLKACQKASDTGMLICVDEEGGTVVRASYYRSFRSEQFRSPRQVFGDGGYPAITGDTKKKDKFLKSLGINCNLAPVADVSYSRYDFIYRRAPSNSVRRASKIVRRIVKQMSRDKVVSCVKHFPGYGNNGDTHGRVIRDRRSKFTFITRDLRPFSEGIEAGADMIMVSHTIVNAFDKKNPASLSKKVNKYIRKNMGFDGVVITDGLGMAGVTRFAGNDQGEAAVRAIKAGNDMICATGDYKACFKSVKYAVKHGRISRKQINESVRRILIMKIRRGIIKTERIK